MWKVVTTCGLSLLLSHQDEADAFFFRRRRPAFHSIGRLRAGGNEDDSSGCIPEKVLILMDAFCPYHGDYLSDAAHEDFDASVMPVLSNYLSGYLLNTQPEERDRWLSMRVPLDNDDTEKLKRMASALKDVKVVAVYCESDSGLADAEALREKLLANGVTTIIHDDPIQLEARRNKYLMQEYIHEKTGLPIVKQELCASLSRAQGFAKVLLETNEYVIVKPHRGVASESVTLCSSLDEVEKAWETITATSVFGSPERHKTVVVQEYLKGTEYAIDVVSRKGQHKIAAIWRYDKRPANGAAFCYFRTQLVDSSMDPAVEAICQYVRTALSGLGVKYGLSHNEVIVTADRGPVSVEVNCRQHNMDFAPLTMACIGYIALDMTLEAFFGDDDWNSYPDLPSLRAQGSMVHLVNYSSGCLSNVHHMDKISALESSYNGEIYEDFQTPGTLVKPTTDIRSDAGWVQLINEDADSLQRDYEQIVKWMPTMFQVTEPENEMPYPEEND